MEIYLKVFLGIIAFITAILVLATTIIKFRIEMRNFRDAKKEKEDKEQ